MKNTSLAIGSIRLILSLSILVLLFTSCQKSEDESIGNSQANLRINLSVGQTDDEKILVGSKNSVRRSDIPEIQKSETKLENGLSMEVSVIKGNNPIINDKITSSNYTGTRAATQTVIKTLEKDVKYRLAIYSESGQYLQAQDYIYGSEASSPALQLDAGKTYTFIIYSVNSKTELPQIDNKDNITTANLKDVAGDLMFFKKTMKLNFGDNNLDAILQHKFSQITTYIEMDDSMTGSIESISGSFFNPTRTSGTIKFSDGNLSYPTTSMNSTVTFPTISPGSRSAVSNSSIIISPTTSNASFNIGAIRIDSETKTNISIPEIKITPGHKYNLIIKFRSCSEDVTAEGMNWSYPQTSWKVYDFWTGYTTYSGIYKTDEKKYYKDNDVIENTFIAPQANYGFQFDITELDNAFNMRVNGKHIFKASDLEQIQFESASSLGIVRNIQFADGSDYATNGIPQIYNMKGSLATPLVRILISRNGEVTLLGSKTNNGPLFPLKLKNNLAFNKVSWNSTGNNTVVVTQKVAGRTIIIGKGSGKKRISCN